MDSAPDVEIVPTMRPSATTAVPLGSCKTVPAENPYSSAMDRHGGNAGSRKREIDGNEEGERKGHLLFEYIVRTWKKGRRCSNSTLLE